MIYRRAGPMETAEYARRPRQWRHALAIWSAGQIQAVSETVADSPQICPKIDLNCIQKENIETKESCKMYLRGIVLIGFSASCLAVVGLAYKQKTRLAMSHGMANTVGAAAAKCKDSGIDTPFGRLGCIQNVSSPFPSRVMRNIRGGARFISN
jgi:hypothetical protein